MKRVFALLLCLALMVVTFASCDVFTTVDPNAPTTTPEGEQQQHTHTFSTTWSSDDEGHWYDATCDCEDAPVQKLAHADKNNDGACDVCEYAQCEHTYSEEWTIDCTNHWHAADCGHIVPGTDVAEHVDENADGKCDVCTYIIEDIHKHYYATEWSGDGEYHWHAALCEHSVEIADKAAHEIDAAGYCTVCDAKVKEIDKTDVKAVLEAAVARNNKVTGGKVEYANYIYDLVNGNLEASSSSLNEIYYTLGNGASYINWITISEWGNTSNQQWYELISLGETEEETEVFGVTTYDGGVTLEKAAGAMQHLNGYNYMPSTLLASFDSTSTLADTLLAIYTLSQAETASEVEVTYDAETGTYSIAYAYVAINNVDFTNPDDNTQTVTNVETAFFAVAALFTVDENGVVDSAAIVVDSYQDAEFDDDYNYDVATGKVEFNENAAPNRYIYSVAQTSGERTYTSAYPKASVLPTSFELSYNDELVGDSITVSAGKFNNLYLVDLVPAVSSLNFINGEIEISAVNNDAENGYTPIPYYSAGEGAVVFYSNQAGSFTLTVTYGDFVKTINVTVEPPKAESIGAYQFEMVSAWGDTWYEASIYSGITNASLNVGETLDFAVLVSPTAAAQGFTYSVDSADATITEVTLTEVMAFDEFFDTYTALQFTATAEGTYTVTLTSTEDANVSSTFVVTVGEEEVEEPVAGATSITLKPTDTYTYIDEYTYVALEPGTYTFTVPTGFGVYSFDSYYSWGPAEVDFQMDQGGTFSVELAANEGFGFYYGGLTKDEFTITVEYSEGGQGGVDEPTYDYNTLVVYGSNTLYFSNEEVAANAASRPLSITADGDYKLASGNLFVQSVVDANGNTIAKNEDYTHTLTAGEYTINFGMLSMFGVSANTACTLNVTSENAEQGGEEGGETITLVAGTYIGTDDWGNAFLTVTVTETEVTFTYAHPMMGETVIVTTYTVADDVVTLYDETGAVLNPLSGAITIDENGTPVSADYNGTTYTLVAGSGEDGEGGEGGETIEPSITIYDDTENIVTVTEDDITAGKLYVSFMPYNSGEYTFASNDLYISAVIDADGNVIERNDNWCFELEAYLTYSVEINASYLWNAGDYTLTPEYQYPLGHQENPNWLTVGEDTTALYNGDYATVWYQFYANATGTLTLTNLSNTGATLMITAAFGYEITNEITYDENWNAIYANSVSMDVVQGRQYFIGILGDGFDAVEILFTTTIVEGEITTDGTVNVPFDIVEGENVANVPAWENLFFAYKFPANGTLTIATESANCTWYITTDFSTYVEGLTDAFLTYEGYEGETIFVCVSTTNWEADVINFTATLKAAPTETYYENAIITDGSAANEVVISDNSYVSFFINGEGQYAVTWDNADAIVEIVAWGADNTPIASGDLVVGQMYFGINLKIYFADYAAGTVNVTLTPVEQELQELVVGENTVSVTDTWGGTTVNLSAVETTTYTLTAGTNAVVVYDYTNYLAGESFQVTVNAGESVEIIVLTADYTTGDVVVTVA